MANIALRKSIMEAIGRPKVVTNGIITGYTGQEGCSHFRWPGTLTVDLETIYKIKHIRFLLWDGMGQRGNPKNPRIYKYRLLTSEDAIVYRVHFDTGEDGYNGWQCFEFSEPIDARYVRIHGLWNVANFDFHVVEIEVHDSDPPMLQAECTLHRLLTVSPSQLESGEGLSLASRVDQLVNRIESLVVENEVLNPQPFNELTSQLRVQVRDVNAIERSMDSIRREIITPVKRQLERMGQIGYWGFIVGAIGATMAIISLLLQFIY